MKIIMQELIESMHVLFTSFLRNRMACNAPPTKYKKNYLGERLSFLSILRWKREGARHTAMFMGVIWFSSTEDVTSLRKQSSVCSTSRFSSDINMMAAWTACSLWSFGTSAHMRKLIYIISYAVYILYLK